MFFDLGVLALSLFLSVTCTFLSLSLSSTRNGLTNKFAGIAARYFTFPTQLLRKEYPIYF
jgi:hypothetical protein